MKTELFIHYLNTYMNTRKLKKGKESNSKGEPFCQILIPFQHSKMLFKLNFYRFCASYLGLVFFWLFKIEIKTKQINKHKCFIQPFSQNLDLQYILNSQSLYCWYKNKPITTMFWLFYYLTKCGIYYDVGK